MGVQNPATPVRTALEGPKFEELRQVCNRIDPDYNPDPLVRPAIRESLEHSGIISIAQMYRMTPKEIAALYRIGSDKACHLVDVIFICLELWIDPSLFYLDIRFLVDPVQVNSITMYDSGLNGIVLLQFSKRSLAVPSK